MSKVNEIKAASKEHIESELLMAEPITREEVLQRTIPWDTYVSAKKISREDLELITGFDKKPINTQYDLIDSGKKYIQIYIKMLSEIDSNETVEYIAAVLSALLDGDMDRMITFYKEIAAETDLYRVFLLKLNKADSNWYLNKELSYIMTKLTCCKQSNVEEDQKTEFVEWVSRQLDSSSVLDIRTACKALHKLLLVPHYRALFSTAPNNGFERLERIISANIQPSKFQLLYEVCRTAWLALYDKEAAAKPSAASLIPTLASVLRNIQKEKVRRVVLAALRNMLVSADNRRKMVSCQLHRLVDTLKQSKWGDPEIEDDLAVIADRLSEEVLEMSSWDMYRAEIMSGVLLWSPVHLSEKFWKENVTHFEDENWEVLGKLCEIVRTGKDSLTLSIAAHDLGEFVRYHPRGKIMLQEASVKVDLMKLLVNENPDVRKNALFALQKIMANKT